MTTSAKLTATMMALFGKARMAGVPILVIRTADQNATIKAIQTDRDGYWNRHVLVQWDAARGITAVPENPSGAEWVEAHEGKVGEHAAEFRDAVDAAMALPEKAIIFVHNAQRQLSSLEPAAIAGNVQAVANARDEFKKNFRMLVLLAPQFTAPMELEHDLVVLNHPLPQAEELQTLVTDLYASAARNATKHKKTMPALTDDLRRRTTEAVTGLSFFETEQVVAMSIDETGLDVDVVWERKRVTIESVRGMKVYRGRETFADIVGCDNVKARLRQRLNGQKPVGVVIVVDEIDKVFANIERDPNSQRMDQFRTFLTEMEDNEWEGVLVAGLPGSGKTLLGKAMGNEAGVPTIFLDFAATEGSLVGESEQRVRQMMDVLRAVGAGNAFILATSNNATIMRPELQRRFTAGFFFFDMMSKAERAATWQYFCAKYGVAFDAAALPEDEGWSGAEIRNCVREAWNCRISLAEAAQYIVPVAVSQVEAFDRMRKYAAGRYLDAHRPGPYRYSKKAIEPLKEQRAIAIDFETVAALAEMTKES